MTDNIYLLEYDGIQNEKVYQKVILFLSNSTCRC